MTQYRTQRVVDILHESRDIIKVRLDDESRAYCFPQLNGRVEVGNDVVINTTAIDLNLGTGGWHFIAWNLAHTNVSAPGAGHIMKLRYTPLQIDTGVAEEFDDWDHTKTSLENMPVIVAPLHSHIPAITSFLKNQSDQLRIAVIISDGASLPLALSDTMHQLKDMGDVTSTITYGHAFGGDIEAINIYTALLSARHRAQADVTIVSMGPGIVGTNTQFGFTGIDVAHQLDAAQTLGGQTFGVLRASQADPRERHRGISHHSITTFSIATQRKHSLALINDHELTPMMQSQVKESGIDERHSVINLPSIGIVELMDDRGLNVSSMGRAAHEDPLFFESAAAAAQLALTHITSSDEN